MENKIEIFNSEEFGMIRTVRDGDTILFCGYDVAKSLGYAIPSKAVNTHCKGVSKMEVPTNGGVQKLLFIRECDVYRLIAHSKLPASESFERWIYEDILPSIRRHGAYITDSALAKFIENPQMIYELAAVMLKERRRADSLTAELAEIKPKADFFDAFINPNDCTNIRTTAKELQISERVFCKYLQSARFLYRAPSGSLMPYAKAENDGLFIVRDYYAENGHHGAYTLITPKGKALFRMIFEDAANG